MYKTRTFLIFLLLTLLLKLSYAKWVQTGGNSDFPTNTMITALLPIPEGVGGTKLLAGTSGGIYLSSNNYTSWTAVDSGLPSNPILGVSALAIDSTKPNGPAIFAAVSGTIFLSKSSSIKWTPVASAPTNVGYLTVIPGASGVTYIFAGSGGKIFRSTDHGVTWTASDSGISECGDIVSIIKSNNCLFAGSRHRIWKSINNGAGWFLADSGNFFKGPCASIDGLIVALSAFSNGTNGTALFAGISLGGGVFLSTNNGATWTRTDSGLTNTAISSFALSGSTVFVGTFRGIFFSTNFGTNWISADTTGFPVGTIGSDVTCLALTKDNVFTGTSGMGVWRLPLSDVSVKRGPSSSSSDQKRIDISICQFSSYISFSLPVKTGSIAIYDVHGRMVAREHIENNTAIWRGNHAPGRFFAQVLVGEENIIRSLIIIR
jgi:hypothetical protein